MCPVYTGVFEPHWTNHACEPNVISTLIYIYAFPHMTIMMGSLKITSDLHPKVCGAAPRNILIYGGQQRTTSNDC